MYILSMILKCYWYQFKSVPVKGKGEISKSCHKSLYIITHTVVCSGNGQYWL